MKIHISIFYKTNWGQNVCIKTSFCQKICLKTKDGLTWFADLDIIEKEFNYHYFVEENNATIHSEPSLCHSIELSSSNSHTTIQDEWFDATYSKVFSSSAFTKCFLPIVDEKKVVNTKYMYLHFHLKLENGPYAPTSLIIGKNQYY